MEVTILNRQRARRVPTSGLRGFVGRLGREVDGGETRGVGLCLVSDRRMREFNREFRGIDAPTDVLSFPSDDEETHVDPYLGDIVISVQTAARQASERGHTLARELKLLALHGYLHLLGYDHETDDGTMMRLQRRLERRLLGVAGRRG